jgi:epoxide hydrolase 4
MRLLVLLLLAGCATTPAPLLTPLNGPWDDGWATLSGRGDDGADLRLHYLAAGPEDGDVVVLLHGFPDFAHSWREVIPLLATDHRVYALDLRGYGLSDAPQTGYDLFNVAGDVEEFVQQVAGSTPVHLIGHDWGAAVGWISSTDHPDRWETFTAIDIPHGKTWVEYYKRTPAQQRASSYIGRLIGPDGAQWLGGMDEEERAGIYHANLVRTAGFTDADATAYHAAFGSPDRMKAPIRYFLDLVHNRGKLSRLMKDAPQVQVRTLVLWGELDMYVLAPMAELSCEHVVDCTAEVWPELGHWLHWEDPERVVTRWRRFVASKGS